MTKGKGRRPVLFNKAAFLLPKMEPFWLDEEAGNGFYVKEIGGKAFLEFKEAVEAVQASGVGELKESQAVDLMTLFVVLSACDAKGNPIFTKADVNLLSQKDPNILLEIVSKAMPLSGMNPKTLSGVAVDLKNDLSASSATDSPTNSTSP